MTLDDLPVFANWPDESGDYKVVQVQIKGKDYLGFVPELVNKHHSLLYSLLSQAEVKGKVEENRFALKGDDYEVLGMGFSDIDVLKKTARFFGHSAIYDIGIIKLL